MCVFFVFFFFFFGGGGNFVFAVADNDDILVCLGFRFVSYFVYLFVCFSHMGLREVYSSSLGMNASRGSERLCHTGDADSG